MTTESRYLSFFDKNITPNLIALAIIALSFFLPESASKIVLNVGLFALSGALTNWLAVHMLFERIPGLYGSGVIPLHFEEFKAGIMTLVTRHLFKKEVVESTLSDKNKSVDSNQPAVLLDLEPLMKGLDLDGAYDQLTKVIMESTFGAMLAMVGGEEALEPLRSPFKNRMEKFLIDTGKTPAFQKAVSAQIASMTNSEDFMKKISLIIETRLEQLTPEMVKDIMQEMIRKHLGWLVVWGGVFGGLIGLVTSLIF